ncbi:ArsR family transcriptional regulator [bacterium]|nr:MAG: ArsR family transcriptional regulator [bacterium]
MNLRFPLIAQNSEDAAELLQTLSQGVRLRMLCILLEREISVGDLAKEVGLSQPAMSQQLQRLRRAGLVSMRREAQTVYYHCDDSRVRELMVATESLIPRE